LTESGSSTSPLVEGQDNNDFKVALLPEALLTCHRPSNRSTNLYNDFIQDLPISELKFGGQVPPIIIIIRLCKPATCGRESYVQNMETCDAARISGNRAAWESRLLASRHVELSILAMSKYSTASA
jgi:hypothetical protein